MDPTDLRAELAERLANSTPIDAETFNSACFMLSRALDDMGFSVPDAAPLVRHLLRVAGRVVIDTGARGASPDVWPSTEEMALQWIDEALRRLGYEVRPAAGAGRPPCRRASRHHAPQAGREPSSRGRPARTQLPAQAPASARVSECLSTSASNGGQ